MVLLFFWYIGRTWQQNVVREPTPSSRIHVGSRLLGKISASTRMSDTTRRRLLLAPSFGVRAPLSPDCFRRSADFLSTPPITEHFDSESTLHFSWMRVSPAHPLAASQPQSPRSHERVLNRTRDWWWGRTFDELQIRGRIWRFENLGERDEFSEIRIIRTTVARDMMQTDGFSSNKMCKKVFQRRYTIREY